MQIPVISLKKLNTDANERARLAQACEQWGFFQLVDHGVRSGEAEAMLAEMKRFFALPIGDKRAISRTSENPWGFFDQELTKNRRDWKQILDIGPDLDDGPYRNQSQWPELDGFREAMVQWFSRCEHVADALLQHIVLTLVDQPNEVTACFRPQHTSYLRLNYYPVCDDPAPSAQLYPQTGHLGISHHTDAGALTVLFQDRVPGLQVLKDNAWVTVQPLADACIINIGDMVEVWSNGRYRAPLHRVLANDADERFSAPFFYNPSFSADVAPITPESPEFRAVNWGEFRAGRAAGDYADLGEEVQISDYRLKG